MHRRSQFLTAAGLFAATGGVAFGGQLSGTMNFSNQTSSRIVQTVAEDPGDDEKEVDFGDFDNDGDLDVVVAAAFSDFGQRRNKLYRNDGGTFNEITNSGIIPGFMSPDVSRNAFFRDFNGDGWLDIWVTNDGNTGGAPGADKVYLSQQSSGEVTGFQMTTISVGLSPECSSVAVDLDLDGDVDMYLGNYPNNNQDFLGLNNGNATFAWTTFGSAVLPSDQNYTVDVASSDMNGDGTPDLLISNWNANQIYYNGLGGAAAGDFNEPNSVQQLGGAGTLENAMEPADFDNDGRNDFYWLDKVGNGDRVWRNTGNNANGQAVFQEIAAVIDPTGAVSLSHVNATNGGKATVADFNNDGRLDVVVGGEFGNIRPAVLRNVTVGDDIQFIDWSPGHVFPSNQLGGWHAAAFDTNDDGDVDILLGAHTDDHLFESVPANEVNEDDLTNGNLPDLFNDDPVAVLGSAGTGETDSYTVSGIGSFSTLSVVLNGPDDYLLEIYNGGTLVADSDRGGLGVEEVLSVGASGTREIRVTVISGSGAGGGCPADLNGTGDVNAADLALLLGAWGRNPGHPADINNSGDVNAADLALLLGAWGNCPGAASEYVLEVLSRN